MWGVWGVWGVWEVGEWGSREVREWGVGESGSGAQMERFFRPNYSNERWYIYKLQEGPNS
ncbi:hypothetical protein CYANOKiyG1_42360 [Okeania sp. KiyG1]|nr:hypothetical protein CYANOKiyG1_42360 [Okeania sp. KiyG1]